MCRDVASAEQGRASLVRLRIVRAARQSLERSVLLAHRLDLGARRLVSEGAKRQPERRMVLFNHPARLNLGDCFIYAQAKLGGGSLLYKGDDFSKTDIESAA